MNDFVRPGRFLATLHAMRSELTGPEGTTGVAGAEAGGAAPGLLQRMDRVHEEALAVLQQIQQSKGAAGMATASASAS